MEALSGSRIRSHNERLVVALLRDHAPLTRAQLSERLGLTRAAMSRIVGSMIERNVIDECGANEASGAGRPGTNLELSKRWAGFGIDARSDRSELLALELGGATLGRQVLALPTRPTPAQFVEAVSETLTSHLRSFDHEPTGLGIAIPGTISNDRRTVLLSHHFGWENVPLVELLSERIDLPIALRHGAECAAIANARQPALSESQRLLHVQIGTGLGLALTRNRDLDETLPVGWGGAGHVSLGDPTSRCVCGRQGCVDTIVGFGAFAGAGLSAGLSLPAGLDGMTDFAHQMGALAEQGHPFAIDALESLATKLGRILSVFITIEVPDSVTLGGYVTALGEPFLDRLDEVLSSHLLASSPIVRTELGARAAAIGAAMVGLNLITTL